MSGRHGKKESGDAKQGAKQGQSWWDRIFGANGLVGLIAVLVALAPFLYTSHMWPFADDSSGHAAVPRIQASTVRPSPNGARNGPATKPVVTPPLAAQSAVNNALLVQADLGRAFADLLIIRPEEIDPHCQPSGQPSSLKSAPVSYGTRGIGSAQAGYTQNYSTITERVNAYDKANISALAQYLGALRITRDNCTSTDGNVSAQFHVIPGAPPLCDQSFIMAADFNYSYVRGYEAFIRCGSMYAYIAIVLSRNPAIGQSAAYGLFKTAARKLRAASTSLAG